MKKISNLFISLIFTLISSAGMAGVYSGSGEVSIFLTHIERIHTDWFSIEGFSNVGSCPKTHKGEAVIILGDSERSKRHINVVLSALMSGRTIRAAVDDTHKDPNGYCYLQYLTVTK